MSNSESNQTPSPEVAIIPPKTPEELQDESDAESKRQASREAAKPSHAAAEIDQAQKARETRKSDEEIVLDWLMNNGIQTLDAELFKHFKNALEEKKISKDLENKTGKNPIGSERLDQTAELLTKLPELFKQVDEQIAELGKDTTKYAEIGKKRIEIIKGVCGPVLDGHLTASDAEALVAGIEIVSKNDPSKKGLFEEMGIRSGYEGVMFCDPKTHKIYIFDETLVDKYQDKDSNPLDLKIRHMVTHEMSHNIVESSVKYNKPLWAKANEIIDKAGEIKDSQSIHIRNTLNGIVNAEIDFSNYFADHLAKGTVYKALPDTEKTQYKEAEKKKFISDRKIRAAAEILTDYTAMYLQSDGSSDDFVMTCMKLSNKDAMIQYFDNKLNHQDLKRINSEKDSAKKSALINELKTKSPKFTEVAKIYQTLYILLRKEIADSKGHFAEFVSKEEEDEDPFGEYSGGGFMDGPAGFTQQENGGNRDKGGGGDGFWKEAGALIAAIAGEIPNVQ